MAARAGIALPAAGAGLVALLVIVPTLLPGVSFWDTAEFQTVGPLLGTAHPTGFPTYVMLGWLASVLLQPLGEAAFRMNLLSALFVAAAASLTAMLVQRLTGRPWLALASGLLLATMPIAWSIGTHADAHALHLALVGLLLVLLVDWERVRTAGSPAAGNTGADRRLVGAAAVYGLALGNHSLVLLLAPGIVLFVIAVDPAILSRGRLLGACALAASVVLAAVYAELPLRAGTFRAPLVYGHPETWDGFWAVVLAEQFRGSLIAPFADLPGKIGDLWRFSGTQLGPLAWLVPLGFLATAWRQPRFALLTAPALALTCWFAASYLNAEISRYYLVPGLIALTWIALLGDVVIGWLDQLAARLDASGAADRTAGGHDPTPGLGRPERRLTVGRRPLIGLIAAGLLLAPTLLDFPARSRALDLSHEHKAADWLDAVLDVRTVGQDAVIVSWWSYSTPLWYAQHIEHRRPDIAIVDDRTRLDENLGDITDVIDTNLGRGPVIVIQTDPRILATLATRYRLTLITTPGAQPVYRVDGSAPGVSR